MKNKKIVSKNISADYYSICDIIDNSCFIGDLINILKGYQSNGYTKICFDDLVTVFTSEIEEDIQDISRLEECIVEDDYIPYEIFRNDILGLKTEVQNLHDNLIARIENLERKTSLSPFFD